MNKNRKLLRQTPTFPSITTSSQRLPFQIFQTFYAVVLILLFFTAFLIEAIKIGAKGEFGRAVTPSASAVLLPESQHEPAEAHQLYLHSPNTRHLIFLSVKSYQTSHQRVNFVLLQCSSSSGVSAGRPDNPPWKCSSLTDVRGDQVLQPR